MSIRVILVVRAKLASLKLDGRHSLLAFGAFLLIGCASAPDHPFTLIKPSEGWVQLKAPPEQSAAIIESAGDSTKEMLGDKKYKVTWFARKTDDYLIYFQVRDPSVGCGDEAPEFYKVDNGWAEDRLSRVTLCKQ